MNLARHAGNVYVHIVRSDVVVPMYPIAAIVFSKLILKAVGFSESRSQIAVHIDRSKPLSDNEDAARSSLACGRRFGNPQPLASGSSAPCFHVIAFRHESLLAAPALWRSLGSLPWGVVN